MDIMHLIFAVFVPVFIGWNILELLLYLGKRSILPVPVKIAISYGIGLAALTLEMLAFHFMDQKFDPAMIIIPWAIVVMANGTIRARVKRLSMDGPYVPHSAEKIKMADYFTIFGLVFCVAYTFFRALIKPLESYDAIAIYGIKSKIFYMAQSVPMEFFGKLASIFPHPDYPLNIPLAQTFVYMCLGNINDQLVKILFPLFYLAILIGIYYAIRRFSSITYSLLFTFILASVPQFSAHATNGYLDIVLSYYVFFSLMLLLEWFKDTASFQYLILSAIMAAFAGWTKNEGLMYCFINAIVLCAFLVFGNKSSYKNKLKCLILYGSFVALISLPWLLARLKYGLVSSDVGGASIGQSGLKHIFDTMVRILYEFQKEMLGPKKWNIVLILLFGTALFRYKKALFSGMKYTTLFLILAVSGYIAVYMTSHLEAGYLISKTWSRFVLHFLPVAIYWMAGLLKDDIKI